MVLYSCRIIGEKINSKLFIQARYFTERKTWSSNKRKFIGTLGAICSATGVLLYTLDHSVKASDLELHPPSHTWPHTGLIRSFDHASVRRGYEVYKQVCVSCHSLRFVAYRNLVGVTHSEAQAKAEAEEQMIEDGPDENGNMFKRPGKLSDYIPNPYPNEEAARAANNGSFPPDLTYITLARHGDSGQLVQKFPEVIRHQSHQSLKLVTIPSSQGNKRVTYFVDKQQGKIGEDYVFALLTGYCDPPAGINLKEGQNFNPYFLGGAIAMATPLFEDSAVYSDGTHAHASQLAKDVSNFLKWAAEPEFDDRKLMMVKAFAYLPLAIVLFYYATRMKFISIKTRKIQLKTKPSTGRSSKCFNKF